MSERARLRACTTELGVDARTGGSPARVRCPDGAPSAPARSEHRSAPLAQRGAAQLSAGRAPHSGRQRADQTMETNNEQR